MPPVDLKYLPTFRGTVVGNLWDGVVEGAVDGTQRVANGLALQAALNYAADNNKFFELEPGRYEIDLDGGITYPLGYSIPGWRGVCGVGGSTLVQYADDTPILTIGDTYAKNSSLVDFDGVNLMYGADQQGNTNANGLVIGSTWRSHLRNIEVGENRAVGARPYRGCRMQGNDANEHNFSNVYENMTFGQAYQNQLAIHNFGTGFVMRNIYLVGDGAPNVYATDGPVLDMFNNYSAQYESVFEQINIEWARTNVLARFAIVRNLTMISVHFEGCELTGSDPHFVQSLGSHINYHGFTMLNNPMRTGDGASGVCAIINDNAGSVSNVIGGHLHYDDNPFGKGVLVNLPWEQFRRSPYEADKSPHNINSSSFKVTDVQSARGAYNNMKLTSAINNSAYNGLWVTEYASLIELGGMPEIKGAKATLNASATLYGHINGAYVTCPSGIATTRTLILSKFMAATGQRFDDVTIPVGRMVTVWRDEATAGAGAFEIKNSAGTTIHTITTSSTKADFWFNGTDWAIV